MSTSRVAPLREIESRVWLVQFSQPQTTQSGGTYNRNFDLTVIAPTLQAAVAAVIEAHPQATLHTVNCRGTGKTLFVASHFDEAQA